MSSLFDSIKLAMPSDSLSDRAKSEATIKFVSDTNERILNISHLENIWSRVYFRTKDLFKKMNHSSADSAVVSILQQGDIYKVVTLKGNEPDAADVITMEEAVRWFATKVLEGRELPVKLALLVPEGKNPDNLRGLWNVAVCDNYLELGIEDLYDVHDTEFSVEIK